jgi:hypothetical protein
LALTGSQFPGANLRLAPSISRSRILQTSHIAATETTSEAVNRAIKELRETAEMATQSAAKTITRTIQNGI